MPGAPSNWETQGMNSPLQPLEGAQSYSYLISFSAQWNRFQTASRQSCERRHFCCLKPQVCGNLFQQSRETCNPHLLTSCCLSDLLLFHLLPCLDGPRLQSQTPYPPSTAALPSASALTSPAYTLFSTPCHSSFPAPPVPRTSLPINNSPRHPLPICLRQQWAGSLFQQHHKSSLGP